MSPRFQQPCIRPTALSPNRKLSGSELRRIHGLYMRRESVLKRIAFIDGQLEKIHREEGL